MLNLEDHRLTLAIAKETLDKNYFKTAQKTMDRIVQIEHDGHFLCIKNQATGKVLSCNVKDVELKPPIEFWNIDTQFGRAGKFINHPANLPT